MVKVFSDKNPYWNTKLGTRVSKQDKRGRTLHYIVVRGKYGNVLKRVRVHARFGSASRKPARGAHAAKLRRFRNTEKKFAAAQARRAKMDANPAPYSGTPMSNAAARAAFESSSTVRGQRMDRRKRGTYAPSLKAYVGKKGTKRYDWPGVDDGIY